MNPSEELQTRLQALVTEVQRAHAGSEVDLLRRLGAMREPPGAADPGRLTGLVIGVAGGPAEVTDTGGGAHSLKAGKDLLLRPQLMKAPPREEVGPGVAVAARIRPHVGGVILIHVQSRSRRAIAVTVNATGLYGNWAQWGPMQLIVRRDGAAPEDALSVLSEDVTSWALPPGAGCDIIGVGYTPRLSLPAAFAAASHGRA